METTFIEAQDGTDTIPFDVIDDKGVYMFYDVRTKVEIEDIPKGTNFKFATFDFCEGTLELHDTDDNIRKFKLKLSVVSEIAV